MTTDLLHHAPGLDSCEQPAFTFRIPAAAKPEIRARLRDLFGYDHSTIYRDYPGFAQFGAPNLKSAP